LNRFLNGLTLVSGFVSLAALSILIVEIAFVLTETTRQLFSQLYWVAIIFFGIDIVLRFALSKKRKRIFFARIMDYALILPLVKWWIPNGIGLSMYTIVQLSLIAVIMGRLSHINTLFKKLRFNPTQLFISGFVLSIFIGALLLSLPQARVSPDSFGFIDALFTATSAICVTGLTTLDIKTHFSGLGQAVILILIQLGGLGIMTFYAMITLVLNRKLSQEERLEYQSSYQSKSSAGTFGLIRNIFLMTFLFEIAGALLFLFLWRDRFSSMWETIYYAVFHSISAFCNAGFSLFPDSLSVFVNEP
jgi:trk system potassium uptake protein